jgi:CelD/BcsL family acetyltransferase involved in cellulose biosynthesis
MSLSIRPLESAANLDELEPEWEELLAVSASDTIFLTPDWIRSWWTAYGAGRDLLVLRLDDGERLVGLAFFYRRDERLVRGLRHRALALVGDGSSDSDYLDWISAPGRESQVVDAVLHHMRSSVPSWDLLLLNEVPETSPHLPWIESRVRGWGWPWELDRVACARTRLPPTWDQYLQTLKPRMRTKVRAVLRDMAEKQAQYERCESLSDIEARLGSLYDLHDRRWATEGKPGVFRAQEKRTFYSLLSERLHARDRLRFYSLRVGDRYVAHQYCFEYAHRMYLLQEGLDPDWFDHGAGNALRAHVFQDCIARGLEVYDFLGGVTPHKLSWGAEIVYSVRVMTGPGSFRNRILFTTRAARAAAKKILRPDPARNAQPGAVR